MARSIAMLLGLLPLFTPALGWAQSAPSPFTSGTRYDVARRVTGTLAPDPDGAGPLHHLAVRNSYDINGRLGIVEKGELAEWQAEGVEPKNWVGFSVQQTIETTYDLMDRKTKEVLWSGSPSTGTVYQVTQYSYDLVGRLECTAVRMNSAVFGSLPTSACTLGTEGTQGPDRITKNFYDPGGRLEQVRKAFNTAIEQAYVTYSYTPNGKQAYVTDANHNKARLIYDGHDRHAQWQFPSATTVGAVNISDYEEYGYDANGNRTSLRKRDGRTFTYAYDNLNRMAVKTVPDSCVGGYACTNVASTATRDVYYSYDAWGRQTAARFDSTSGADAVTSVYDGFGLLSSSTTSMGGVSRTLSYQYDANGNRTRVTHPDQNFINYYREGLDRVYYTDLNSSVPLFYPPYDRAARVSLLYRWVGGAWGIYSAYGYDGVSRLASISSVFASGGYNVTSGFAYNSASQIVSRSRDNNAYAFAGYTAVNRSYVVNGLNQYSSAGGISFGYDSNGNLTASGSTAYTYDAENRLVAASTGANLTYDPLGRLYETYSPATGNTRFLYDGDELVAEYDASGNMLRRYVHGLEEDDPQVWYEGAGVSSPRYLYSDHQGSVVAVTDAAGNLTKINAYDEYGIPNPGNDVTTAGRFQYTGQAWIPELGMYHYKARIYSPTLGKFLQTDPIGYTDQINLYAYVGNDPVNGRDPTGEACNQTVQGSALCGGASRESEYDFLPAGLEFQKGGQSGRASSSRPGMGRGIRIGPNLRFVEGGRLNAHAVRTHVGRTLQQLRQRIRNEGLRRASTFNTEGDANAAYRGAVQQERRAIESWLYRQGGVGQLTIKFNSPTPIGRVLEAGARAPRESSVAVFHIRANNDPFLKVDIVPVTGYLQ